MRNFHTRILLVFSLFIVNSFSAKANIQADFQFTPPGAAPATVNFIDYSTTFPPYPNISWVWNFGDGYGATTRNTVHTYVQPGTYLVKLVVTNSIGQKDSVTKMLVVQPPPTIIITPTFASNSGKEFWFGYGHHQFMEPSGTSTGSNQQNLILYFSAGSQGGTVNISIDSSGPTTATGYTKSYFIPANTTISTENFPKGIIDAVPSASDPGYDARLFNDPPPIGTGSEGLFRKKGIHIESTVPIVVHANVYGGVSSGMTTLLPVNTWGYNYYSINSEQRDADRSFSWIYVIAREDSTQVEITPSAVSRLGKPANTPFTVTLMKGQIYQLLSNVPQSGQYTGPNFTGTNIRSKMGGDGKYHPIAVFAGSSRTGGEILTCGTGSGRENDVQQLFPVSTWGTTYLTAPLSKTNGSTIQANQFQTSVYKVLVKDPTTVVKRNGAVLNSLINSSYYIFSSNTADVINSDKPVSVAQFISGTTLCNGGQGDPDMVYLSPVASGVNQTYFPRTTRSAITVNYVTLIVPTQGLASLRIDSSNVFSHTYVHPTSPGYTVVIKGWTSSSVLCRITCDSAFTAISYGLGAAESYVFNAGINIITSFTTAKSVCAVNGAITLNSDAAGNNYRWQVSKGDEVYLPLSDNANYSGSSTASLQVSNLPDSMMGYSYRCVVDGDVSTSFKIAFKNEWTGGVDNSWEQPLNWSCGRVPGFTTDVIIPAGSNVTLSSNVTVHTLTVSPGATFTVAAGFNLTITN